MTEPSASPTPDSTSEASRGDIWRHEGHHDAVQRVMRGTRDDDETERYVWNWSVFRILDIFCHVMLLFYYFTGLLHHPDLIKWRHFELNENLAFCIFMHNDGASTNGMARRRVRMAKRGRRRRRRRGERGTIGWLVLDRAGTHSSRIWFFLACSLAPDVENCLSSGGANDRWREERTGRSKACICTVEMVALTLMRGI